MQRGPISCGIASTEEMHTYKGGIFKDTTGLMDINHEISITGWGEENGEKYWNIRNSWGQAWGEQGFMRLIRGVNNMAIESDCAWAVPVDTWTKKVTHQTTPEEKADPANKSENGPYPIGPAKAEAPLFLKNDDGKGFQKACRLSSTVGFKNGEQIKDGYIKPWERETAVEA